MWTWLLRLIPIVGRCSPVVIALIVGAAGGWYVTNQYHEERAQEEALQAAIERAEQGKREYAKISELMMSSTLQCVALVTLTLSLTGCASSPRNELPPVLATWTQKQSTSANDFSQRVRSFLSKVESYYSETH